MKPSIHGYNLETNYTNKFYRELSPDWIDLSLLKARILPPRATRTSHTFTYLELGCGLGLTLIFLAAFHPEGSFIGIDYSASHIIQARQLAHQIGITNIRFLQADIIQVAEKPRQYGIEDESIDYVVAHGLMTWVSRKVQKAVLTLSARTLACGGAFFCSYNCLPGWLSPSIIQQTYKLVTQTSAKASDPASAYALSREYLSALQRDGPHGPSPLKMNNPSLAQWLSFMDQQDHKYIHGEFGHESWRPVYSGDFHRLLNKYQLTYVSSCTYPETLKELLSSSLLGVLAELPDPFSRASMEDIGCNRSFRRDIFIKGPLQISDQYAFDIAGSIGIFLTRPDKIDDLLKLNGPYGEISADPKAYSPILEFIKKEPRFFSELTTNLPISPNDCLNRLLLLLDAGIISISTTVKQKNLAESFHSANMNLLNPRSPGHFCGYLMAPNASNVVSLSATSAIILFGIYQGLADQELVSYTRDELSRLGGRFIDDQGITVASKADIRAFINQQVNKFMEERFAYLQYLGAVP